MTPEEKKAYIMELAKRGYDKAARVKGLFDELAVKSAKLKVELRVFKDFRKNWLKKTPKLNPNNVSLTPWSLPQVARELIFIRLLNIASPLSSSMQVTRTCPIFAPSKPSPCRANQTG